MEYFFSSTAVPIIKVLIAEMRHMFSLENIPVLRSMTYLNPDIIPKENEENSLNYGENISTLCNFHGKQGEDDLNFLAAEYNRYKAYQGCI